MKRDFSRPRQEIADFMERIYRGGMTTLSGGNLSIMCDNGQIFITPAGVDKGNLCPDDIVLFENGGSWTGGHAPSTELPFHQAVYVQRNDIRAIVHAHPPALVAYSIAGKIPEIQVNPCVSQICGSIGFAPYAMTGSEELGKNIASTFAEGYNIVILENHGVVSGGKNLLQAYQRMEALEFCAQTLLYARQIGEINFLSNAQLKKYKRVKAALPEFKADIPTAKEKNLRKVIAKTVRRACERNLMFSVEGDVSARVDDDSFLITPTDVDRFSLGVEQIVLIKQGMRESSKHTSRAAGLHRMIYETQPDIQSVITSQPPHAMAYAITMAKFETHTIPESYIMLRDIPKVQYDTFYDHPEKIAQIVSQNTPVLLIENEGVLTSGRSLIDAYDRLEVLEFSASSLLAMPYLGGLKPIDERRISEIKAKFFG